jgi:hypothetical protein
MLPKHNPGPNSCSCWVSLPILKRKQFGSTGMAGGVAISGNHRSVGRTPVDPDELGQGKRRGYLPASGQFR